MIPSVTEVSSEHELSVASALEGWGSNAVVDAPGYENSLVEAEVIYPPEYENSSVEVAVIYPPEYENSSVEAETMGDFP